MPQNDVYGAWPASGEIDIAESRGNDAETYNLGDNIVTSSMHWGTTYDNDAYTLSSGTWGAKREKYSEGYHTFGLEWSEDYLFTWLDGRLRVCMATVLTSSIPLIRVFHLQQVLFFNFNKAGSLWTYGGFSSDTVNGSALTDPWSHTGRDNTPFDQPFYLILSVAVGATNGYFP